MTEKELLKKLNTYKDIQADSIWKEKNREVLFNQIINSSSTPESGFSFAKIYNSFKIYSDIFYNGIVKNLGQPVILTSMIVLTVLGGGIMSINASRNTTPGDSLYIAKKISEKTQFVLTFGDKKKAQLNVSFAENRAREIAQIMSTEKPEEEKKEIVERLTGDFKKEISSVKTRIEKIAQKDKVNSKAGEGGLGQEDKVLEEEVVEEDHLFTANLGKKDEGLSMGEQITDEASIEVVEEEQVTEVVEESTTTVDIIEVDVELASTSEEIEEIDDSSSDILSEVKDLIESDDFDASLEKLDEVNDIFEEEVESGEVKGVMEAASIEEAATSTEE